jgi:hypothetical protein
MRALIFAGLVLVASVNAQADEGQKAGCDSCRTKCPSCNHSCDLKIGKDKVKKHCYGVACKTICIPPITFPWNCNKGCGKSCGKSCGKGCDKGCGKGKSCPEPTRCAKSKTVRVLKKFEYECEKCSYKWTPSKGKCGCNDRK